MATRARARSQLLSNRQNPTAEQEMETRDQVCIRNKGARFRYQRKGQSIDELRRTMYQDRDCIDINDPRWRPNQLENRRVKRIKKATLKINKGLQKRVDTRNAAAALLRNQRNTATNRLPSETFHRSNTDYNDAPIPDYWADLHSDGYQRFVNDFYRGRAKGARKHDWSARIADMAAGTSNACEAAGPPDMMPYQGLLYRHVQRMCADDSRLRGILLYHGVGAGKTASTALVADALYDTDYKLFFVTTNQNMNNNNLSALAAELARFSPRWKNQTAASIEAKLRTRPNAPILQSTSGNWDANKRLKSSFINYSTFAKVVADPTYRGPNANAFAGKCVFVFDEAHMLFDQVSRKTAKGGDAAEAKRAMKGLEYLLNQDRPQHRLVLATGTPGNTPEELVQLMSLLQPLAKRKAEVQNLKVRLTTDVPSPDAFKKWCQNLVSFVDTELNMTQTPQLLPLRDVMVSVANPSEQRDKLLEKLRKGTSPTDITARKLANAVFGSKTKGKTTAQAQKLSAKSTALAEALLKFRNDKQYVYSFSKTQGINDLINVMATFKDQQGRPAFKEWLPTRTVTKAEVFGKYERQADGSMKEVAKPLTPQQLLALGTRKDFPEQVMYIKIHDHKGDVDLQRKLRLRAFGFRQPNPDNSGASAQTPSIGVLLATGDDNTGLDLKGVKHIHFMEPQLNRSAMLQGIGRAVRTCSHKGLPKAEWNVRVHRYNLTPAGAPNAPPASNQLDPEEQKLAVEVLKRTADELDRRIKAARQVKKDNKLRKNMKDPAKLKLLADTDKDIVDATDNLNFIKEQLKAASKHIPKGRAKKPPPQPYNGPYPDPEVARVSDGAWEAFKPYLRALAEAAIDCFLMFPINQNAAGRTKWGRITCSGDANPPNARTWLSPAAIANDARQAADLAAGLNAASLTNRLANMTI